MVDDGEEFDRMPLLPVIHKVVAGDERGLDYVWNEPVEIGIESDARIFTGSPIGFQSDCASSSSRPVATNLVETAEKTLKITLDYVNIKLDGGNFR